MAHVVKTTIVTSASGEITGYGFCVEAEHSGAADEISAAIVASLDMLRATIAARFAPAADPPAPGLSRDEGAPVAPAAPPATPEEAETRFYARYGEVIGGATWADVRRYLRQPRRLEPGTVEQWIATAAAVRDYSRAPAAPAQAGHGRVHPQR